MKELSSNNKQKKKKIQDDIFFVPIINTKIDPFKYTFLNVIVFRV
jgi:hypothetical protein